MTPFLRQPVSEPKCRSAEISAIPMNPHPNKLSTKKDLENYPHKEGLIIKQKSIDDVSEEMTNRLTSLGAQG